MGFYRTCLGEFLAHCLDLNIMPSEVSNTIEIQSCVAGQGLRQVPGDRMNTSL